MGDLRAAPHVWRGSRPCPVAHHRRGHPCPLGNTMPSLQPPWGHLGGTARPDHPRHTCQGRGAAGCTGGTRGAPSLRAGARPDGASPARALGQQPADPGVLGVTPQAPVLAVAGPRAGEAGLGRGSGRAGSALCTTGRASSSRTLLLQGPLGQQRERPGLRPQESRVRPSWVLPKGRPSSGPGRGAWTRMTLPEGCRQSPRPLPGVQWVLTHLEPGRRWVSSMPRPAWKFRSGQLFPGKLPMEPLSPAPQHPSLL